MKDLVLNDFGKVNVIGHVLITLQENDKTIEEIEQYNDLTTFQMDRLKWKMKSHFVDGCPNQSSLSEPMYLMRDLLLLGNTIVFPIDMQSIKVVGYNYNMQTQNTDEKSGIVLTNECFANSNMARYVFYFGKTQANGVINSICWGILNSTKNNILNSQALGTFVNLKRKVYKSSQKTMRVQYDFIFS